MHRTASEAETSTAPPDTISSRRVHRSSNSLSAVTRRHETTGTNKPATLSRNRYGRTHTHLWRHDFLPSRNRGRWSRREYYRARWQLLVYRNRCGQDRANHPSADLAWIPEPLERVQISSLILLRKRWAYKKQEWSCWPHATKSITVRTKRTNGPNIDESLSYPEPVDATLPHFSFLTDNFSQSL